MVRFLWIDEVDHDRFLTAEWADARAGAATADDLTIGSIGMARPQAHPTLPQSEAAVAGLL